MKKGMSYIDWMISLGIFLIYLVVIFIVFKPGIAEEYPEGYLTDIVRENIQKDASWNIIKIPLFVDSSITGNWQLTLDYPFEIAQENTFIFGDIPFAIEERSLPNP